MKPCPKSAVEDAWKTPGSVSVSIERFVNAAVVAKKFVLVELVVVELTPVKFWSVEDPFTRRFPAESEPEIEAEPPKRFVNEPVVEKKLVEVAFVDVEF